MDSAGKTLHYLSPVSRECVVPLLLKKSGWVGVCVCVCVISHGFESLIGSLLKKRVTNITKD